MATFDGDGVTQVIPRDGAVASAWGPSRAAAADTGTDLGFLQGGWAQELLSGEKQVHPQILHTWF